MIQAGVNHQKFEVTTGTVTFECLFSAETLELSLMEFGAQNPEFFLFKFTIEGIENDPLHLKGPPEPMSDDIAKIFEGMEPLPNNLDASDLAAGGLCVDTRLDKEDYRRLAKLLGINLSSDNKLKTNEWFANIASQIPETIGNTLPTKDYIAKMEERKNKLVLERPPSSDRGATSKKEQPKSVSILTLTHDKAREYFLKPGSYCDFGLPPYFKFEAVLSKANKILTTTKNKDKQLSNLYKPSKIKPREVEGVNYKILNNKDGKYAWRPLQLINPVLYVSLVHQITSESNWKHIQASFNKFTKCEKIECTSIPRESRDHSSDKAEQRSDWSRRTEGASIEMALDYSCLTITDLTDCYGAIYTHSVAWALHGKKYSKDNKNNPNLVGNQIDIHLRDMSHGQTNGIPQGSALMDFIAEMVLGYADRQIACQLRRRKIAEYKIIRYRDDYRIYSKSSADNDKIIKCIAEVMVDLGLKLSAEKTKAPSNLITGAIKDDKLFWLKQKHMGAGLQNHLLIIHDLAIQFPNSGSLVKALRGFDYRLRKTLDECEKFNKNITLLISVLKDVGNENLVEYARVDTIIGLLSQFKEDCSKENPLSEKRVYKFTDVSKDITLLMSILKDFAHKNSRAYSLIASIVILISQCREGRFQENPLLKKVVEGIRGDPKNITLLISILTDIAHKNPRTYSHVMSIVSLLLWCEEDYEEKKNILEKVIGKFDDIPNTGHLEIWIQRIALGIDSEMVFNEPLCSLVGCKRANKETKEAVDSLWNFSWLKDEEKNKLDIASIVDKKTIDNMPEVMSREESESSESDYD